MLRGPKGDSKRKSFPETNVLRLGVEPRRWQRAALSAWRDAGYRGIVEVVTGGGKTVFAELCIAEMAAQHENLRVVVIVPTLALVDQWYICLREELNLPEEAIATWSGRSRPRNGIPLVNLMVVNTARSAAPYVAEHHSGPAMLIVDECHRAGSPRNAEALRGVYVATLGMSATPEREYDSGFESWMVPAIGKIAYRYDLNEAGEDGILSPFDLVNVEIDLLADEANQYRRLTTQLARLRTQTQDEESVACLEQLLRRRSRIAALATARIPVTVSIIERHRGVRSMIFHEDIAAAERIRTVLYERGHSVTIYHSRLSTSVRRDNLRLYRKGVFDVLVSCRALDEGINIPETQVAVVASGSASLRQRVQRLGRVLRPAPGKDAALVYTLFATPPEAGRLRVEENRLVTARSVTWMKATTREPRSDA